MASLPAEAVPPATSAPATSAAPQMETTAPTPAPTDSHAVQQAAPDATATTFPTAESLATPSKPTSPAQIILRAPSTSSTPSPTTLKPPTLTWLQGPWNVTHSTLPMWKKSRNVRITYTPIPSSGSAGGLGHVGGTHLDDVVTYQSIDTSKGGKVSTVKGVDKPFATAETERRGVGHHVDTAPPPSTAEGEELASLGYNWRGKGWLMIASSKWEILGFGDEQGGNGWVVTYFAKTLFTPAGVDFYSRKGRLQQGTVEEIKKALEGLGGDVGRLGKEVFEVAMDDEQV